MTFRINRNRDEFEYWLFDMDEALEGFLVSLPARFSDKLDYSPQSLDTVEMWLLEQYPNTQAMLDRYEYLRVDDAARYIGETFRRTIGGYWDVKLEDPTNAYFGLPILTGYEGASMPICPITLATASVDRRNGKYIRTVLENVLNRSKDQQV